MKKALMVLVATMLMMGLATGANAAFVKTVSFYLVDDGIGDANDTVVLTASTFSTNPLLSIANLYYRLEGQSSWTQFGASGMSGTLTFSTPDSTHAQLIYLQYNGDSSADMSFQSLIGNSGTNTTPSYLDLYTTLTVIFSAGSTFNLTVASTADGTVAPVPISPSVYLMGAGLIGLVGLRKRFQQ